MKKRILALLVAAAVAVTSLAGCGGGGSDSSSGDSAEKTVKITISVPDPDSSYIYQAAEEFAKRANEYSDGSLEFTVSGNGSLYGGDTAAGIKQLSAGSLQMLILSTSVYASFEPGYNMISVPYLFDDQQQLLDYLNSDQLQTSGQQPGGSGRSGTACAEQLSVCGILRCLRNGYNTYELQ